jgi:hypothetical protein
VDRIGPDVSDEIKRMDIAEFRRLGYLEELNRRFLHPLGLALEINVDDKDGTESLGGIWDYREDPEGIFYDVAIDVRGDTGHFNLPPGAVEYSAFVDAEMEKRRPARIALFGGTDGIQPLPEAP